MSKSKPIPAKRVSASTTLDASNMFDILVAFPKQVEEGVALGRAVGELPYSAACRHIVVLGMGGSAIAGDLLRTYMNAIRPSTQLTFSVVRDYVVPDFIRPDDFVIASSYSGGTEETLSAFAQIVKKTKRVLCISAGGELTMQARSHAFPLIRLPLGLQPRCAVGYSFFPLVTALAQPAIIGAAAAEETERGVKETIALLKKKSKIFSSSSVKINPALALAKKLAGSVPVIYTPSSMFEGVGLRWRNQLHENAKQIAFGAFLPEMNHNEIESWSHPKSLTKKFVPVLLRDKGEHPRVAVRFEALKELIGKRTGPMQEIWSEGSSPLARMFSLLYFGDWVSYYLALENKVDPTAIPTILKLKTILSK